MSSGFILDLNRCTGCDACRIVCTIENQLGESADWRRVFTFNEPRHRGIPLFHLSLACNHCLEAPCMKACPTRAFSRDPSTGAVLLDPNLCMGCKYCSWSCPYDAPRYDSAAGVMGKCTFCNHRLLEARDPACVVTCPTGALRFGDLDGTSLSKSVAGFPGFDIGPLIRFLPLRRGNSVPQLTSPHFPESAAPEPPSRKSDHQGVTLQSEGPIAVFTLIAAILAAAFTSRLMGGAAIHPSGFLVLAFAGLGVASLHLGKKSRAWRSVFNVGTSWLSREILAYLVFNALAVMALFGAPGGRVLGWAAAAAGFGLLYSIDRVYDVTVREIPTVLHSAGCVLTGLFLSSLFAGWPVAFVLLGSLKLVLYGFRKARGSRKEGLRGLRAVVRIGIGLLAPAAVWLSQPSGTHALVMLLVLTGEIVDRFEYYSEMRLVTPGGELDAYLARILAGGGRLSSSDANSFD